jgi:hypothetical protein
VLPEEGAGRLNPLPSGQKWLCGKAILLAGTAFFMHLAADAFTNFPLSYLQVSVEDDRGTVSVKAKSRKALQALRDVLGGRFGGMRTTEL